MPRNCRPGCFVAGTAATLVIELGAVFLIFLPRRLRAAAAVLRAAAAILIVLTGNYNFFNLLTMLLCVFLFDDAALRALDPAMVGIADAEPYAAGEPRGNRHRAALALIVVPVGLNRIWQTVVHTDLPVLGAVTRAVSPLSHRQSLWACSP